MKTLQEALSKSMIKKLEKHNSVLTKFTKKDLENGDLLIDTSTSDDTVWMYLDAAEMRKRINEFKELNYLDKIALKHNYGFIVCGPKDEFYRIKFGSFRIPINRVQEKNNGLVYNVKNFTKLIKYNKYLDDNLKINEIYYMKNFFKDYL